ncbi:helix-turn-helix domain-containing protein [Catellatospora sp. KI3]|uniref:TetR/AcrR family transcriptional regulator n=1 Tax=Catellatospora sp. KI3 TaxID=3041620 RepID=UPI0024830F4D|nr:TetR/AcrR family transcriptional regulator [Catellatospora sp. KI3]MDI1464044.1 helix-turn-helix domain-containing protein [Catellatospora sp. KI3]
MTAVRSEVRPPVENARLRARRRADLLAAARALFLAHGVDAVTVEQIADHAAVTRRTVYRYFPSRDHLALAIEAEILERWAGLAEQAAQALAGDGAQRLAGYLGRVEALVDGAAEEIGFTRVFDATALGVREDCAEAAAYAAAIRRLQAPLVGILRTGAADGSLAVPEPVELTAATIANGYLALAQRVHGRGEAITGEQGVVARDMLTAYAALIRRGLRP